MGRHYGVRVPRTPLHRRSIFLKSFRIKLKRNVIDAKRLTQRGA
jgi:hypothetical protein